MGSSNNSAEAVSSPSTIAQHAHHHCFSQPLILSCGSGIASTQNGAVLGSRSLASVQLPFGCKLCLPHSRPWGGEGRRGRGGSGDVKQQQWHGYSFQPQCLCGSSLLSPSARKALWLCKLHPTRGLCVAVHCSNLLSNTALSLIQLFLFHIAIPSHV